MKFVGGTHLNGNGDGEISCVTANFGKTTTTTISSADALCPFKVDKTNWNGASTDDNTFLVTQLGTSVTVTRVDPMTGDAISSGNGMYLYFDCCIPAGDTAKVVNVMSSCLDLEAGGTSVASNLTSLELGNSTVGCTASSNGVSRRSSNMMLLSQGKPTEQSSVLKYGSSLAVDGDIGEGVMSSGTCTHTSNSEAKGEWWLVDLQSTYNVAYVELYNRVDCCGSRLTGFTIRAGNTYPIKQYAADTKINPLCSTTVFGSFKVSKTIKCVPGTQGRYVYLMNQKDQFLQLCEVKVYGSKVDSCSPNVVSTDATFTWKAAGTYKVCYKSSTGSYELISPVVDVQHTAKTYTSMLGNGSYGFQIALKNFYSKNSGSDPCSWPTDVNLELKVDSIPACIAIPDYTVFDKSGAKTPAATNGLFVEIASCVIGKEPWESTMKMRMCKTKINDWACKECEEPFMMPLDACGTAVTTLLSSSCPPNSNAALTPSVEPSVVPYCKDVFPYPFLSNPMVTQKFQFGCGSVTSCENATHAWLWKRLCPSLCNGVCMSSQGNAVEVCEDATDVLVAEVTGFTGGCNEMKAKGRCIQPFFDVVLQWLCPMTCDTGCRSTMSANATIPGIENVHLNITDATLLATSKNYTECTALNSPLVGGTCSVIVLTLGSPSTSCLIATTSFLLKICDSMSNGSQCMIQNVNAVETPTTGRQSNEIYIKLSAYVNCTQTVSIQYSNRTIDVLNGARVKLVRAGLNIQSLITHSAWDADTVKAIHAFKAAIVSAHENGRASIYEPTDAEYFQCYLAYCNAHSDLKHAFCNGATCSSQSQALTCKNHWEADGWKESRSNHPDVCSGEYLPQLTPAQVQVDEISQNMIASFSIRFCSTEGNSVLVSNMTDATDALRASLSLPCENCAGASTRRRRRRANFVTTFIGDLSAQGVPFSQNYQNATVALIAPKEVTMAVVSDNSATQPTATFMLTEYASVGTDVWEEVFKPAVTLDPRELEYASNNVPEPTCPTPPTPPTPPSAPVTPFTGCQPTDAYANSCIAAFGNSGHCVSHCNAAAGSIAECDAGAGGNGCFCEPTSAYDQSVTASCTPL